MRTLKDVKLYKGYLPLKYEKESAIEWIGSIIGGDWKNRIFFRHQLHTIRYRFGDINEAQIYMKDKSWKGIPIGIWMKILDMDGKKLDNECWEWIRKERRELGFEEKRIHIKSSNLLEI